MFFYWKSLQQNWQVQFYPGGSEKNGTLEGSGIHPMHKARERCTIKTIMKFFATVTFPIMYI